MEAAVDFRVHLSRPSTCRPARLPAARVLKEPGRSSSRSCSTTLRARVCPKDAIEWYERNLDYNVFGGKLNRRMSVVGTAKIIKDDEHLKAAVLGWGIELLQAFFLVSNDMMDALIMRRDQPCWYCVPKVGQIAINDSFLLEATICYLKKHFRGESYYVDILGLFLETTFQTERGSLSDEVYLIKSSRKKYSLIMTYKTAYYSFYLPVAVVARPTILPLREPNHQAHALPKSILIPLGEYFQIQDDFLDFSGTPEQIGTDILDNKCS
ncbi:Polyprenyl synthetase-domain-containing protein [Armillaria borealis]|uniref:(2E,6E)-farnesyl diphosphate synthase n=1 Tax=Armillaria borealis TaxID=47425 RepID=A0AA39IV05_9AGAR|nr:Polyprenyl synthetase-domain-containing protein [Armillaria borealis]